MEQNYSCVMSLLLRVMYPSKSDSLLFSSIMAAVTLLALFWIRTKEIGWNGLVLRIRLFHWSIESNDSQESDDTRIRKEQSEISSCLSFPSRLFKYRFILSSLIVLLIISNSYWYVFWYDWSISLPAYLLIKELLPTPLSPTTNMWKCSRLLNFGLLVMF